MNGRQLREEVYRFENPIRLSRAERSANFEQAFAVAITQGISIVRHLLQPSVRNTMYISLSNYIDCRERAVQRQGDEPRLPQSIIRVGQHCEQLYQVAASHYAVPPSLGCSYRFDRYSTERREIPTTVQFATHEEGFMLYHINAGMRRLHGRNEQHTFLTTVDCHDTLIIGGGPDERQMKGEWSLVDIPTGIERDAISVAHGYVV